MRLLSIFIALLALAACNREQPVPASAPVAATAKPAPGTPHKFSIAIDAADFAAHVRTLASDEFEGRAPGSIGEQMTTTYLKDQFERLGLAPGNNGSFFQRVQMVETTALPDTSIAMEVGGSTRNLVLGTDAVLGTRTAKSTVKVVDSDLVFVGYGVNAPEAEWNDYAGLDVKGKTVVILINDPGFLRGDAALFKGRAMTYYGRWTYKFEEAARQGAVGALIVHDTEPAAYGWDVVKNSWSGPQFDLTPTDDPEPRLQFQGWLSDAAATSLFKSAGQDLASLKLAADARGFNPLPLNAKVNVSLSSAIAYKGSENVVAVLPGASTANESVLYMGHWDHLGKHAEETGDNIYNGAIDNATGVAGVLEIAEAFVAQKPAPARSIIFFLPTLEESGLLGSRYFVAHPTMPLSGIKAVINMDAMHVGGRTANVAVVGAGQSNLEDALAEAIAPQQRVNSPEASPEKGYYFRSDH
ncbi:MAG: M28 family metallopeptidase, partial [Lysobacterales bacterium]